LGFVIIGAGVIEGAIVFRFCFNDEARGGNNHYTNEGNE